MGICVLLTRQGLLYHILLKFQEIIELHIIQEGNVSPTKSWFFCIFLLIVQHKWMFLSTIQTLSFEGHNVAYQCKGFNQSYILCEYLLTNEKVITEK